jgi:hypothetical protein
MVKRYLEGTDTKCFETVRECLEAAIKDEGITECYYDFLADGNCASELFESSRGHVVEPKEMVRIAEKFFNEFDWVHFEGIGKNGKAYVSCYLAEETKDSFAEKRIKRDKERTQKLLAEWRKDKSKESYEKLTYAMKHIDEWKEK